MSSSEASEARLIGLLESLNRAIRAACFDEISKISEEIETILQDCQRFDRAALLSVSGMARRNIACLEAASQGLRAGRRRLAEIAAAGQAEAYDRSGARVTSSAQVTTRRL